MLKGWYYKPCLLGGARHSCHTWDGINFRIIWLFHNPNVSCLNRMKFRYSKLICKKAVCTRLTDTHKWMVSSTHRSLLVAASEIIAQRWFFPLGKSSFREWNITSNQCRFPWILLLMLLNILHRCRINFECVRRVYCVPKQKLSFSTFVHTLFLASGS